MSASIWKKELFANIGSLAMCKRVFQHETKPEGEIPFYKIGTFGSEPDAYISKTLFDEYKKLFSYPNKGDILISASGTIGRTVIFDGKPSYFQDSNIMWLAHDESKILNEYLYFLYKTIRWNLEGSTIKRLYTDNFKKIGIIFPKNIEEQKKIANILSTCDTVIQNTQKTIDKYKAIKQGMMQDLFTRGLTKDGKLRPSYKEAPELYKESELGMIPKEWEIKQLKDLIISINTGLNPRAFFILNTSDARNYYVTIKEMEHGKITFLESTDRINDSALRLCNNRANLEKDDVLFSGTGTIGRTVVIKDTPTNWCIKEGVYSIKIKTNILNPFFLSNMLQTETIKNEYKKSIAGGTVQSLSMSDLSNQLIYYPIIKEQIEIAKRLSSIDSTIQKEEAILEKYKNIKTGLMARLLTPPEDAEIIDETGE